MKIKNLHSQQGSSLVETMIAIAILGISFVGYTQQSSIMNAHANKATSLMSYQSVSREIGAVISDMGAIRHSLIQSSHAFRSCIETSGNCTNNAERAFRLFRLTENTPISGTQAAPVYYKRDGETCNPQGKESNCLFKAYSKIRSKCFNGSGTCQVAHALIATYTLEPIKSALWGIEQLPEPITVEMHIDTRLVSLFSLGGPYNCGQDPTKRFGMVVTGVSLSLETPICSKVEYFKGPKGDKGPTGPTSTVKGPQGPY